MDIAAKLDDMGRWAWLGVMVLGFILFWPLGVAVLVYLIWSGRMHGMMNWARGGVDDMRRARGHWHGCRGRSAGRSRGRHVETSGNTAFDEYRAETLRRLEEEQSDFREFLDRLRQAKDKAEFDQFMADRRRGQQDTPESPEPGPGPQGPSFEGPGPAPAGYDGSR